MALHTVACRAETLAKAGHPLRELRCRIAISLIAEVENDAKPRFAAHHAFVRFSGSFQWKDFVHRLHSVRRAKLKRVLRINGRARVPAFDRPAATNEQNGINKERACCADYHK